MKSTIVFSETVEYKHGDRFLHEGVEKCFYNRDLEVHSIGVKPFGEDFYTIDKSIVHRDSEGLLEPIQKIFTGDHIDLSKIISFSEIIDEKKTLNDWRDIRIECQLKDKPIELSVLTSWSFPKHQYQTLHVPNIEILEEKYDDLINLWREYRNQ